MAEGHDEALIERVPSYGKGDPGRINFVPMMTMIALRVVKVTESAGGITLLDNAASEYQTPHCEVLAVGPQVLFTRVGDMVRIPAGVLASKLFIGKMDFVMVREDQLFGIDKGAEQSEYARECSQQKLNTSGIKPSKLIAPNG